MPYATPDADGYGDDPVRLTRPPCAPRTLAVTPLCPPSMARPGPWRLEDYDLHRQLYKGKASLLYSATCKLSGARVALKLYRKARLSELNWWQVTREVRLHARLAHPAIVDLYAAFEDGDHVYLVQEYADGGDLYTRLKALQRQLEFFEIQVRARREGGGAEAGERGTKGERGRAHRAPPRAAVWSTHPFPPPPSPHPHQEEYIREEQRSLKRELLRAQ